MKRLYSMARTNSRFPPRLLFGPQGVNLPLTMKKTAAAGILILIAFWTGCSHPHGSPALTPASSQKIFDIPQPKVWNATLAVLTEDLNMPLDEVIPQKGMVSTEWMSYRSEPGDFQEINRGYEKKRKLPRVVEYRVVAMVKTSPAGTMLRVRRYQREFDISWRAVPTDLSFERQFLNLVSQRLGVFE